MRAIPRIVSSCVLVACALLTGSVHADEAREQSRAAFRRGVTLAKENNYAGARDAFADAYRLFPHPSILLNLGIARGRSGQLAEAEQDLAKFLADDGGASPEEIKSARQMLADVREKLGTLMLDVKTAGANATLDGKAIALVPGKPVPVRAAAGQHALHVEAEGHLPVDQTVDLVSKIDTPIAITLEARSVGDASAVEGPKRGVSRATIGWVSLGGGAALGAVGAFFGVRALGFQSDYNALPSAEAQADQKALKEKSKRDALIADILYGGAVIAGGVGVYLVLVKPSDPSKARASVAVGPTFIGLDGRF